MEENAHFEMRPLQAVVVKFSWKNIHEMTMLIVLGLIFIPGAFLLICYMVKRGYMKFIDVWDENW